MIEKIEINGNDYKVEEPLKKYVEKRIGKLDRYLPKGSKKELIGGKVISARDECSNVFAGVDLVEAKLMGQIRRYKLEMQPHRQKRGLKNLFRKRG